jgi:hypothetical protein
VLALLLSSLGYGLATLRDMTDANVSSARWSVDGHNCDTRCCARNG